MIATCPSCGADITFRFERAVVNVCAYCKSVVARTDRGLADLGKVSDLITTESPLDLGLNGTYEGVPFELSGRAQLRHPAGGVWDEWYAAFADGRWGWLAEAQGKLYLTFEALPEGKLPPYDALTPGLTIAGITDAMTPYTVAERNEATLAGAAGEIPYKVVPGARVRYADLSAPHRHFATIDYGDAEADLYAGREVTLAELGLAGVAKKPSYEGGVEGKTAALACPKCGGALALKAPDSSLRVTCPYCHALIDVRGTTLAFLSVLTPTDAPTFALGTRATFEGQAFEIVGWMERSVTAGGERYPWREYLLYAKDIGFRWLVEQNGHYSFVAPVSAGDVSRTHKSAVYRGRHHAFFSMGEAAVDHVEGEFYWRVSIGETVHSEDFIDPPKMVSLESSNDEINWSIATYIPRAQMRKTFPGVTLPPQLGVAPNQPAPGAGVGKAFAIFAVLMLLLGMVDCGRAHDKTVLNQTIALAPQKSADEGQVVFTDAVHIAASQPIGVAVVVPSLDNSWAQVSGALVSEATGLVQSFDVPVEYYAGVDDGEAWSEGSRSKSVVLSALPEGDYAVRLEIFREKFAASDGATVRVTMTEGVKRPGYTAIAIAALLLGGILVWAARRSFEKRRWENSDASDE